MSEQPLTQLLTDEEFDRHLSMAGSPTAGGLLAKPSLRAHNAALRAKLAEQTARAEQAEQDRLRLQQRVASQRINLSRKYLGWAETKVGLQRTIEYLRAKTTGETPLFGHGAKDEVIADLTAKLAAVEQERDSLRESKVYYSTECQSYAKDLRIAQQQLADRDARITQLQKEIALDDALIAERDRVLNAIPCLAHGPCVPHALEWSEKKKKDESRLARVREARIGMDFVAREALEAVETLCASRRLTIEASIAAEVLSGNQAKEAAERAALVEVSLVEQVLRELKQ